MAFLIGMIVCLAYLKLCKKKKLTSTQNKPEENDNLVINYGKIQQLQSEARVLMESIQNGDDDGYFVIKFEDTDGEIHEVNGFDHDAFCEALSNPDWTLFLG